MKSIVGNLTGDSSSLSKSAGVSGTFYLMCLSYSSSSPSFSLG